MPRSPRAFTIIEILIVVAIIAILSGIAVYNFLEAQTRARVTQVKSDMRTITIAIEAYYNDTLSYPRMNSTNRYDPHGDHVLTIHDNFLSYQLYDIDPEKSELGPGGGMPTSLTTPVSYMSTMPGPDPFIGKMHLDRTGTYRWTFYRANCSYFFYDFAGCYEQRGLCWRDDLPEVVCPAPLRLNGPTGPVINARWALLSPGPDKSFAVPRRGAEFPYISYQFFWDKDNWQAMKDGVFSVYDPTNGTTSAGDLWRTDSGPVN